MASPPQIPLRDRISATVPEACQAAGIGPTMLYALMRDGSVETIKIGRRRLVLVRSLIKLIEGDKAAVG